MKVPSSILCFILLPLANAFATNGDEKAVFMMNHLQESEAYLLKTLADVEAAHWNKKTDPESWSISECAEHILSAEKGILHSIQEKLKTDEPTIKAPPSSDEQVLNFLYDRVSKRVKTIEPLEPKGTWKSREEFVTAFKQSRAALYAFLKSNDKNLEQYFAHSPVGEISLFQNVLLLSGHTARHTNQIEEVKHELGLATATISFGGSVKVNVHTSQRVDVNKFFGELLLLKVEKQKNYDRVFFDGGGFVAFVYHDSEDMVLPREAFAKSMQAGLKVPAAFFETIKRRIIAFGLEEYVPGPKIDPNRFYYFHAPGGQVFRLVKS